MVEIIGAPFDLCGKRFGSRLGPDALRIAGLHKALEAVGKSVSDVGNLPVPSESTQPGGIKNYQPAFDFHRQLKAQVTKSIFEGKVPVVLGGDHSISIGSVAGALAKFGDDLALVWIDAHADMNTAESSWSNDIHGMSVGALTGLQCAKPDQKKQEWDELLSDVVGNVKLKRSHVAWLGLRDLDKFESDEVQKSYGSYVATMFDIDTKGLVRVLDEVDAWIKGLGVKHVWVSFDVDVLDPILAPGTGTAVRGGLTYREMHTLGELFYKRMNQESSNYRLVGMDLVETNPLADSNNVTAITAIEFMGSLFGKSILF